MKAWRRSSSSGPSSSSPAANSCIAVRTDGTEFVECEFTAVVIAVTDISLLDVGGDDAAAITTGLGTSTLVVEFFSVHNPGEVVTVSPGLGVNFGAGPVDPAFPPLTT